MNPKHYELLMRSFDDTLSSKEKEELELALKNSSALRNEKEAQLKVNDLLKANAVEGKPFFAGRLMNKITELQNPEADWTQLLVQMFPKFAVPSLFVILFLLVNIYMSEGSLSVDTLMGISDLSEDLTLTESLFSF